ncbi:DUF3592 domain-containing protein [Arthrobacter sp. IK3]|uniref:DUF3592 domain-containing protein n=1 Tax=Arthrobacter sp. IK3 TaxID=3448169 RepID=UPI003EE18C1D
MSLEGSDLLHGTPTSLKGILMTLHDQDHQSSLERHAGTSAGRRASRSAARSKKTLIVLGAGLILTGAGALPLAGEVSAAVRDSPSVTGTVIDVRLEMPEGQESPAEGDDAASPRCAPVIGYEVDGQQYNMVPGELTENCEWPLGQEMKIAFDRENPLEARIATDEFNPATLILPGAGVLTLLAGAFLALRGRRKRS